MAKKDAKETRLKLESITVDESINMRASGLRNDIIDTYAQDIKNKAKFPRVEVYRNGTETWLADGFHRYYAHERAERKTIEAIVYSGGKEDAEKAAVEANKENDTVGLRRTNADKRMAVERALKLWPDKNDQGVADLVGVDQKTVYRVREQFRLSLNSTTPPEDSSQETTAEDGTPILESGEEAVISVNSGESDKPKKRKGKDGKWYPATKNKQDDTAEPENSNEFEGTYEEQPAPEPPPKPKNYITLDEWNELTDEEKCEKLQNRDGNSKFNGQETGSIEWALWSWNPVTGCKHGCNYCYARDIANRFYKQGFEPSIIPDRLDAPKKTKFPEKKAQEWMGHKNVFTCSMADLFGSWVPAEWIKAILAECGAASQWNFLFLTKFPKRLVEFKFPENCWIGTTVNTQAKVQNAERIFSKVDASVKWLSVEPLLEPLKFKDLALFDWLVIGGASLSSETPRWVPPRSWITQLEYDAIKKGVKVYEKINLFHAGEEMGKDRVREYPGVTSDEQKLPESMR